MSLSIKKITQNTIAYASGLIGQKVVSFFYFILIARFLGAEDIGKYVLALSITTLLLIIIDSGISPTITRETARSKKSAREYLPSIILYKAVASVIIYTFAFFLVHLLGYPQLTRELVYLAGVVMVLDTFSLTFYAVLRGVHKIIYESIAIVIYQIVVIGIGFGGLSLGADIHILMVALIVASFGNVLFSFHWVCKYIGIDFTIGDHARIFRKLIKYSLPFAATAVFIKIHFTGDTILLSLLSTEKELGLYSVAHKLVFALEFIPLAFVATLFPALSTYFKENKDAVMHIFQKASGYLMIIATPLAFGGYVVAEPLTLAIYGKEFAESSSSLSILFLGILFLFLNYPLGSLLGATKHQKTNMYIMGFIVVLSVILNVYLIPVYGGVGSAIAFFISSSVLFLLYIVAIKTILKVSFKKYFFRLGNATIIAFLMGVVVDSVLTEIHWLYAVCLGTFTYLAGVIFFKVIHLDDIKELKYIFTHEEKGG